MTNKAKVATASCLSLVLISSISLAGVGPYIKLETGYVHSKFDLYGASKGDAWDALDHKKAKTSPLIGAEIGYRFSDQFRSGIGINHFRSSYSTSVRRDGVSYGYEAQADITARFAANTSAVLLNGYYDIPSSSVIRPYIGAGVGLARHITRNVKQIASVKISEVGVVSDQEHILPGQKKYAFALNAALGVQVKLSNSVSLDISAKYFDYGKMRSVAAETIHVVTVANGNRVEGSPATVASGMGARMKGVMALVALCYRF